ncbi:hypothetical protein [Nocardiopsis rhodophaea]|uniref:hypothetical protein n=1 Tax=Nocardiopsis rhodophaea TaxID=280238 RepID=UPI0031DF3BD6
MAYDFGEGLARDGVYDVVAHAERTEALPLQLFQLAPREWQLLAEFDHGRIGEWVHRP